MNYQKVVEGVFLSRPNRFIAMVETEDGVQKCHVKNTGRCREILVPGADAVLAESDNPDRKTRYDLVAAWKNGTLINIDSQAPNAAFGEFVRGSGYFGESPSVFPEHTHGDSRFDFYVESDGRRIFIEVKGVTLEHDGVCSFPDAPTERGLKHLRGLRRCVEEGYEAYVAFIVQMAGMKVFEPNYSTHEEFGKVLQEVHEAGVGILVFECDVAPDGMSLNGRTIPFRFR